MKKQLIKSIVFSLVAAALITLPVVSHAQDTNAPAAAAPAPKAKKLPFHGKAAVVDTAAMTVKVGDMVINVTSETKIAKNGKPATLSDIMVGDSLSGSYVKTDDGKMNATKISDGLKKKKAAAAESGSTNAPAAN